jgi:antitoxin component YwqK of YwqJK toxin-antitoxin module
MVGQAAGLMRGTRGMRAVLPPLLFLVPALASAQALVARGACREGQINGAYEIRAADGGMRVSGAYAKGRRTGTFLFWSSAGVRVAAIPYDDDARAGTVALWYTPAGGNGEPQRKLEATYADDSLHGPKRSWYPNGNPRAEFRYERGQLVEARAWAEAGAPLPEAEARAIAEHDIALDAEFYATLERIVADHRPACGNNGR